VPPASLEYEADRVKAVLEATVKVAVNVKFSLCLTKHHAMNMYWRSGVIPQRILNLGIRLWLVVSFTLRPLYPQGKSPRYLLARRLGGEVKNPNVSTGIRTHAYTLLTGLSEFTLIKHSHLYWK
jgi:hypothetical protein